jgi:hypothetical protein
MGRGFIKYEFPDSDREPDFVLFSAHLYYRLPDGERLHVRQTAAWCQSCGKFTLVEYIESVAELEAELPGLIVRKDQLLEEAHGQSSVSEDLRSIGFDLDWTERAIAEVPVRIAWRRKRQSPPKCLHCGTSNLLEIDDPCGGDPFTHPHNGERVISSNGFASTEEWHAEFTPEGELLWSDHREHG